MKPKSTNHSYYRNDDIESLIGKKAYKSSGGLFDGFIGVVEKNVSEYGVTPLVLVTGSGRMGVRPEDLTVVEDDEN